MERSRAWTITINNYTDEDLDKLLDLSFEYLIIGFEVGEEETPHIQGYIYFENQHTLRSVSKMIPRAHLEKAKGSPQQNFEYCKGYAKGKLKADKENEWYEFGTLPAQGKRSDLDKIRTRIEDGESLESIAESNFGQWCFHRRAFKEYQELINKPKKATIAIYDGNDIDKWVIEHCNVNDVYFCESYDDWRGYTHQPIIIIGHHWVDIPIMRRLIMGIPCHMKIPYGTVLANPEKIIINGTNTWKALKLSLDEYIDEFIDDSDS